MVRPETEIESQAVELSTEAFRAFCDDISGMFGVEIECEQQEAGIETLATLKKRFKKLVAVGVVDSEGALNGTFQLILDREAIFTLGGVVIMLSEESITANRKDASAELAESMVDAVGEAGNLLIESWDRVFSERLDGHGHFVQRLPVFVGEPWDKPEEKMGLAGDEELLFIPYTMTVGSFPTFTCGVIFPRTIFDGTSDSAPEPAAPTEEKAGLKAAKHKAVPQESDAAHEDGDEEPKPQDSAGEEAAERTVQSDNAAVEEKKASTTKVDGEKESMPEQEPEAAIQQQDAAADAIADDVVEDKAALPRKRKKSRPGAISEAIRKMAQSGDVLPVESVQPEMPKTAALGDISELLRICARDVMQNPIVWADPEDSVQQALTAMQRHNVGYVMIGRNGVLEGIVSRSDITGAVSPYLRPMFAKWRRPLDDATLKIRLKWIMSSPVRTARPQTTLAAVMEDMCRFGGRALPVVDDRGKVEGLVTAFDMFQALLSANADVPTVGEPAQAGPSL